MAASGDHEDILQLLFEHGADMTAKDVVVRASQTDTQQTPSPCVRPGSSANALLSLHLFRAIRPHMWPPVQGVPTP